VFVISHKPTILKVTDKIMVIGDGELKAFETSQKIIDGFGK
jgi:ABC-type protease/lipase transport system fused ATPase/permease subunit